MSERPAITRPGRDSHHVGDSPEANPWTTLDRRFVYENPWISVREDQVVRPDGQPGIYGVVHFKNLAVGVLPVDDQGRVWLVGQYRYPLNQYSWEIPEGGCPEGEDPASAAHRELREETGLLAERLELLGTLHLSNSVSDELAYVFRATGLTEGPSEPEALEQLQVRRVSREEALTMLRDGQITDSLSVYALLHESRRWEQSRAPRSRPLQLDLLPGTFAIARLDARSELPDSITINDCFSFTRSGEAISIVALEAVVPADMRADRGWRMLEVLGPMDLAETGVIAGLSQCLAREHVPIFAVSTFDTDFLLVPGRFLERAIHALRAAGYEFRGCWSPG